ncbi:hypothetical protein ASPCAL12817 [Aspergillus calidoustus]|uniref:Hydrophobin n=1 Tax=Aspergillus calidoustus TaxID=454130 RepID=A0A0U5H6M4_ASPCI|nr:hypothetical protein ASPCAL12817 [Aspergillus calidoustus]
MKFIIPTILSVSMVAMALPKDIEVRQAFQDQCTGLELSCCSGISQANPTEVTPTAEQAGLVNAVVQVVGAVTPTNLLSGCAPLIGSSTVTCQNYVACCVPDELTTDATVVNVPLATDRPCRVLKDIQVSRRPGLLGLGLGL